MENLVFHIGLGKTGTSSIQLFLNKHRHLLEPRGVYYPKPIHGPNHIVELLQILRKDEPGASLYSTDRFDALAESEADSFDAFVQGVRDARERSLVPIISQEQIVTVLGTRKRIEGLARIFGTEKVKIILYVRRIDHLVEAMISQIAKAHTPFSDRVVRTVAKTTILEHDRIGRRLEMWSDVFGAQNLIVRPFERESLVGGSVVSDFADALGLTDLDKLYTQRRDAFGERNVSPSVEIIRLYPRFLSYPIWQRSDLEKRLERSLASKDLQEKLGPPCATFLSPRKRNSLVKKYAGLYAGIASTYQGRDRLFAEDAPPRSDQGGNAGVDDNRNYQIAYDHVVQDLKEQGIDAVPLLTEAAERFAAMPRPTLWHRIAEALRPD